MTLRCCPACSRRISGQVAPDCPICAGTGTLTLGAAALHRHGPDVTARAVELQLEQVATFALAAPTMTPDTARDALAAGVGKLRRAGLLSKDQAAAPVARRPLDSTIAITLDAPPVRFLRDDRPIAAGIPGFSVAGYISRMARCADPMDLMGPSTAERFDTYAAVERRALYLAAAAAQID